MQIKCWGSRGSIPVSGKEYVKYGGDTTCIEIRTDSGDIIIVDAGTGIRRLGNALIEQKLNSFNFLFTHSHWDHIIGFPAFKPLFFGNTKINVYMCPFPGDYIEKMLATVMRPPNFPVRYADLKAEITYTEGCPDSFNIGSVRVDSIPVSHPDSGCGYRFTENGKSFVFLTDNELGFTHPGGATYDEYRTFCEGADLLLHDAEYTEQEYKNQISWGHSSYTDALQLAIDANVKKLGLFHINAERSDEQMDKIVTKCQEIISEKNLTLECFGTRCDLSFTL